jgi:hypothetical protein
MSCTRTLPLLVLLASGCDKLERLWGDEPEPSAELEPADAPAEPTPTPDIEGSPAASVAEAGPSDAPDSAEPGPAAVEPQAQPSGEAEPAPAEPAPAEPPPVSEFDSLLVRLSELADPRAASDASVEQDNKAAWVHYKAKDYPAAVKMFARVAARDPEWKHAHNIACASAKAGKPDDVRIALAESFRRGGEPAKASAKKDSDLASIRKLEWFTALLDEAGGSAADVGEDHPPPPSCPPGVKQDDDHWCLIDILAPFSFAEVVFDQPITLDLEVPARPSKQRWKTVRSKIPWKELRAELGIQHTIEFEGLSNTPSIMGLHAEGPLDDDKPFFWWPEDNTAVLVLPHLQKIGKLRIRGVILARKTDAGWRAINLPMVTGNHEGHGGSSLLETGIGFRYDGFELFTLAQVADGDARYGYWYDPGAGQQRRYIEARTPENRWLCRIRWEQGKLARACTDSWRDLDIDPWYPD